MWRTHVNKPSEQQNTGSGSNEQTAPGKAPPSFRQDPAVTKDGNPSKDAPGRPATGGAAKGDDDAMSQPTQQPRKPS